ncbi:HAMP domain-containing sensor histidine kinase [Clostridium sp. AM58-1XD]|uniref:sensor histidine kinase n=1 Tax=Clostridium sp. AM58-1XD TaxID=2292307 RepID=UPI0015F54F04|nr:HAMP domain-containing sensor histidine kinase [Clostridium sp. AM58-1XD]
MKNSIRFHIFLPVGLLLVLFPVMTWLLFGAISERYVISVAAKELDSLLIDTDQMIQNTEQAAEEELAGTEADERQLEKERSKRLLSALKSYMKDSTNQADMMVFNTKLKRTYPKQEEEDKLTELENGIRNLIENSPPEGGKSIPAKLNAGGEEYIVVIREGTGEGNVRAKYLAAYAAVLDEKQLLVMAGRMVFFITALLAVCAAAAVWTVSGSISRPVKRLCRRAEEIGNGCFERETGVYPVREINALHLSMEQMAGELEQSDRLQKEFFQNVSHELRTPLMSVCGYAQGIQCGVFKGEEMEKAASVIMSESLRMKELVDGILMISRIDSREQNLCMEEICLGEFIEESLEKLNGLTVGRKTEIHLDKEEQEIMIEADGSLLFQAFYNVAANAVRYAEKEVWVRLKEPGTVIVEDDGPGIAPEDRDRIFERFYRGKSGNHGIGLTIAKSSLEYMGGSIEVENREKGARFILKLPGTIS